MNDDSEDDDDDEGVDDLAVTIITICSDRAIYFVLLLFHIIDYVL